MHLSRAIPVVVAMAFAVAFVTVLPAFAQTAPTAIKPSMDLYVAPEGIIPSGNINITPNISPNGSGNVIQNSFNAKPVAVDPASVTNLQGCGGVGQGEYTSGVYNMPESFGKFQTDVDSLLSKQLLTMNYIMPQTAALFDQLNNYGNQKYESFQKGCSLDALKQDARKQYLDACVAKQTPTRVTALNTLLANSDPKPSADAVNAMAYAQAWEMCSNLYVSDTTIVAMRKKSNEDFAKQTRAAEDVNATIKPWLCKTDPNKGTGTGYGCFASFLIPQVRLCFDGTLDKGCTDSAGYGLKDPIVSMPHLVDIYRFILDDEVVSKRIVSLTTQIRQVGISAKTKQDAATDANLFMSTGTVTRLKGTTTSTVSRVNPPKPSVEDFQLNYLACRNDSIMFPMEKYMDKLQTRYEASIPTGMQGPPAHLTMPALDQAVFDTLVKDRVQLMKYTPAPLQDDVDAFSQMLNVSLSCAANNTIPMLDPNITVALDSCSANDKYAFYTMAGYDVSLAATRDVYRYVNSRLKQVYTRLMTEQLVPVSATAPAGTSPTVSPELNARLATAVKESMIPYIDGQLERIDELSRMRGQYAQRVEQIYATKSGCMSYPALPANGPVPATRPKRN